MMLFITYFYNKILRSICWEIQKYFLCNNFYCYANQREMKKKKQIQKEYACVGISQTHPL